MWSQLLSSFIIIIFYYHIKTSIDFLRKQDTRSFRTFTLSPKFGLKNLTFVSLTNTHTWLYQLQYFSIQIIYYFFLSPIYIYIYFYFFPFQSKQQPNLHLLLSVLKDSLTKINYSNDLS